MHGERWMEAMTRISKGDAVNIDGLICRFDRRWNPVGRCLFPEFADAGVPETPMKNPNAVTIGVRLIAEPQDAAAYAFRLIAFAMEHDAEVIVLSSLDYTGLEKYGFRTERIAGETAADRHHCEAQILRFWNIDLVI